MDNILEFFPSNLKYLRKEHNMSQEEVANAIGLVKSLISKYERGDAVPTFITVCKLASFYGVSIDSLVTKETIDIRERSNEVNSLDSLPPEYLAIAKLAHSYNIPSKQFKRLVTVAITIAEGND